MLICITGPESSGKTALASYLAAALQVTAVEEFARGYLNRNKGRYTFEDLDAMALGQLNLVLAACDLVLVPGLDGFKIPKSTSHDAKGEKHTTGNNKNMISTGDRYQDRNHIAGDGATGDMSKETGKTNVVITDTFLLVILIWSLHKYGKVSDVVMKLYTENPPDFYLLCRPDLPWESDALRENEHDRERLFEMYLEHIRSSGIPYFVVEGIGENRLQSALQKIERLSRL